MTEPSTKFVRYTQRSRTHTGQLWMTFSLQLPRVNVEDAEGSYLGRRVGNKNGYPSRESTSFP